MRAAIIVGLLMGSLPATAELLVSSDLSHEVFAHDLVSGAQVGGGALVSAASGGLDEPHGILPMGGQILVASFGTDDVKRYDRSTGAHVDSFLPSPGAGLDDPVYLEYGPSDGHLYVSSQGNDQVLRFDAVTGAAVDGSAFISGGSLTGPSGFDWSPDGSLLYVAGRYSANVLIYDAATGAPAGSPVFASGLSVGTVFGVAVDDASGDVFVASGGNVRRYTSSGTFVTEIVIPGLAIGLEPGPAGESIYVAANNNLYRIELVDNSVGGPILSGSAINILNFFHIEPTDPQLQLTASGLESGGPGVDYYTQTFTFSADAWGAVVTFQWSDDLETWNDAGAYTVGTTEVTRNASTDSIPFELSQVGSLVTVKEGDAVPVAAGPDGRYYRARGVPGGS